VATKKSQERKANLKGRVLTLTVGKTVSTYLVFPLRSDWGRAFRLEKQSGERMEGEPDNYDVMLNGKESSCECMGFCRWGHCKHVDSLAELKRRGRLA